MTELFRRGEVLPEGRTLEEEKSMIGKEARKALSVKGTRLVLDPELSEQQLRHSADWSPRQWQVIQGMLMELRHAEEQRRHWRSLIAQEVVADPLLLSLIRLCGVRELVAFALGAIIGDIQRFAEPRKLVKYIGLNPAFDDSGEGKWEGGIGGHGRKDLRSLLIEAAHAILRCSRNSLAQWGKKLLARKGSVKLAVAAIARKLTVAIWYLMNGRWTPLGEIDQRLFVKIGKIITTVGKASLQCLGTTRQQLRTQICDSLKTARTYVLNPNKTFIPNPQRP
jgi:transposase